MKKGKSLSDLAIELERQQTAKRDFVADTRKLSMNPESNILELDMESDVLNLNMNRHAHQQVASWAKIPQKYYDMMPADLRATNVNHWLQETSAKRMVRTLDGNCRAFLSDRYRCLDNFELASSVLPVLSEVEDMRVESCELTDRRMYIKALFPKLETEISVGDVVQSGVVISNSEIGDGSLRVEPLIYRLVCSNGMISNMSQKKYHVGKSLGQDEAAHEIFRGETIEADDRAFWMKIQDTVRASVNQAQFEGIVEEMRRTMGMAIETDPITVVERMKKPFGFTESESNGVLTHLIQGGDLNAFGVLNAITRTAQDIESYDRATEFERIGGKIIELSPNEWHNISKAA